jgi:hypothetical protein
VVIFDKLRSGRLDVTDAFFLLSTHETKIYSSEFLLAGVYPFRKFSLREGTDKAYQPEP